MNHITEWPVFLHEPGLDLPILSNVESEKEAWSHLYDCQDCQDELISRVNPSDRTKLEDPRFWGEVQDYLNEVHPTAEKITEFLIMQARFDQILHPSEDVKEEMDEKWGSVFYHLVICSTCSNLTAKLSRWLKAHNSDVHQALWT